MKISFKMPKMEMPDVSNMLGPVTSQMRLGPNDIKRKISDATDKLDIKDSFDLSRYPNPRDKAIEVLNKVPEIANIRVADFVPDSFLNKIDTRKMTNDINGYLSNFNLGGLLNIQLPNDIGKKAEELMSGKGLDFSSLYGMPAVEVPEYKLDSNFDIDEMFKETTAATNMVKSKAKGEEIDFQKTLSDLYLGINTASLGL